jgi:hypothetical protein
MTARPMLPGKYRTPKFRLGAVVVCAPAQIECIVRG